MTEVATPPRFSGKVFIGVSVDGFIARPDGDLDWLIRADPGDTGYEAFMAGIDTLVMGRGTYEKALTFGYWPYEGRRTMVLSSRLSPDADPRITVHRDLEALLRALAEAGARRVYVDGGKVVQTFLRAGLVDELTVTTAPILLGSGMPLFGPLESDIELTHRATKVLGAGYVQSVYDVAHAG
ncbi:dihydrofolate reductase family protein [Rhizohabitans arisaemae]|uniref:dihydrofolate reductase family protein n=1 Tax=Rhizohabitans arisaemae TaxID=2720610 RepID=UPI0024B27AFD|nr:dihydrofolate reductase family protein [Rhizohabitans arisaemae]